ncbi:hypothetical protein CDL15_Pgr009616 [Punica granatum]|uniref:Uncharacterized protein n=1 Tax=Punica granatum TaxID=22663 RepID=A0A218WUR1_PUNGR|nr:hypothetical protein CDL15_Pgr009616 [Punica granatum]
MKRRIQWTSDLILFSPNAKYVLHRPLGHGQVLTGKPATVQHILKTHFSYYQKGDLFQTALRDMLGDGFLNADERGKRFGLWSLVAGYRSPGKITIFSLSLPEGRRPRKLTFD